MAEEYPEYSGLSKADLEAKLEKNFSRQDQLEPTLKKLRADARLAEQERIEFQRNYKNGYKFSEFVAANKKLEANPNDAEAAAEVARIKQLQAERKAAIQPYQDREDAAYAALQQSPEVQEYNQLFSENGDIDHAIRLADDKGAQWGGGTTTQTPPEAKVDTQETAKVEASPDVPASATDAPAEEVGEAEIYDDADDETIATDDEELGSTADKQEAKKQEETDKDKSSSSNVTVTDYESQAYKVGGADILITKIFPAFKSNILHNFSSYTYNFDLYMLGVTDYNQYISDESFSVENQTGRLLISSAGTRLQDRQYNPFFKDLHYYIDDLEINSVIAPSGSNQGSTNTEISFRIIEPYGVTLFNNLVLAARSLKSYNYVDQPYLLKITFKGYDDKGNPVTPTNSNMYTRYIPLRFTDFKFNINESGTEYNVTAIPYHNLGVQSHKVTIPTDVQLDSVTIGDLLVEQIKTVSNKEIVEVDDNYDYAYSRTGQVIEKVQGGLAGYLNYLEKEHVEKKGKAVPDEYAFEIDPEIGNSKIVLQETINVLKSRNEKDPRKIALGQFSDNFKFDDATQTYTIRAGTSIIKLIHSLMRTSTYMTEQVVKEALSKSDKVGLKYEETLNKPIKFYRIVPRVELKDEYDIIRNCWAKKITYVIKKYEMRGKNFENLGQAQINEFVKSYKYLYTGQNDDVLGFDINFNAAFFQENIYNAASRSLAITSRQSLTAPENIPEGQTAKMNPDAFTDAFPVMYEVVTDTGSSKDISDPRSGVLSTTIDHFMQSVFDQGADMIELNMEIVGDPSYIQSTDIRQVLLTDTDAPYYDKNGSLNTDKEWHIDIEFKNPIDADTRTGLMEGFGLDKNGNRNVTAPTISGYYKALEVTSKFSGGQFTQNLRCIREKQAQDFVDEKDQNSENNPLANNPGTKNGGIKKNKEQQRQNKVNNVTPPVKVPDPQTAVDSSVDDFDIDPDGSLALEGVVPSIPDLAETESIGDFGEFGDLPNDISNVPLPESKRTAEDTVLDDPGFIGGA